MSQMKIKVLINNKDAHIKETLFTNFAETQAVIALQTSDQLETLSQNICEFQPDIVLFAVHNFSSSVIENISFVKRTFPGIKTLLFMTVYDDRYVYEGLDKVVDGILLDNGTMDDAHLFKEIYDVCHDQFVLSGELAKMVMLKILHKSKKELLSINLAKKQFNMQQWELDFLYLLLKRYSDEKIAALLQLKKKTISDYLSHCYRKFNINGRDEIITFLDVIIDDPKEND